MWAGPTKNLTLEAEILRGKSESEKSLVYKQLIKYIMLVEILKILLVHYLISPKKDVGPEKVIDMLQKHLAKSSAQPQSQIH